RIPGKTRSASSRRAPSTGASGSDQAKGLRSATWIHSLVLLPHDDVVHLVLVRGGRVRKERRRHKDTRMRFDPICREGVQRTGELDFGRCGLLDGYSVSLRFHSETDEDIMFCIWVERMAVKHRVICRRANELDFVVREPQLQRIC